MTLDLTSFSSSSLLCSLIDEIPRAVRTPKLLQITAICNPEHMVGAPWVAQQVSLDTTKICSPLTF